MTEREALARIAALCDEPWRVDSALHEVRDVLAEVTPEAGSRSQARRLAVQTGGVTLTADERKLLAEAAHWHASMLDRMASEQDAERLRAVAARLGAAS